MKKKPSPKTADSATRLIERSTIASTDSNKDAEFEKLALKYKFIYSMTGLFLGLVCMIGGIVLFLNGVTGSTSWTAKILGNESIISDAAPGAVLFLVGLFVVMATRYKVRVDAHNDKYGFRRSVRMYRKPLNYRDAKDDLL